MTGSENKSIVGPGGIWELIRMWVAYFSLWTELLLPSQSTHIMTAAATDAGTSETESTAAIRGGRKLS